MSNFFKKYEITKKIASGGMAEIYKAYLHGVEGFKKEVAVKMIRPTLLSEPEFVDMFISEATLAARLDHPNIVRVNEFDEIEGIYYIVMEYVKGMDLRSVQKFKSGPWDPSLVFFLGVKILAALDYAHSLKGNNGKFLNLIHRDVTPHNIMLSVNGEVKLADFGIAKVRDAVSYTKSNMVRGKLHYLSPEQARGEDGVIIDSRSDLFSLGLVLWELLTGRRRYINKDHQDIFPAIMEGKFIPPSSLNSNLDSKVDELMYGIMAPLRENRWPNAEIAITKIQSKYFADWSAILGKNVREWYSNNSANYDTDLATASTIAIQNDDILDVYTPSYNYGGDSILGKIYGGTKLITELHSETVKAREGDVAWEKVKAAQVTEPIYKPKKNSKFKYIGVGFIIISILALVSYQFIKFSYKESVESVESVEKTENIEKNIKVPKKTIKVIKRVEEPLKDKNKKNIENIPKSSAKSVKIAKKRSSHKKKSQALKRTKEFKGKVIILRPKKKKVIKKITKKHKPAVEESGLKSIEGWD